MKNSHEEITHFNLRNFFADLSRIFIQFNRVNQLTNRFCKPDF